MTSTFIVEVLTSETNRQGDTFTDIFFSGSRFMCSVQFQCLQTINDCSSLLDLLDRFPFLSVLSITKLKPLWGEGMQLEINDRICCMLLASNHD
jgi:hypothetical protein